MIVPPTGSTFDGHTYILPDSYVAAAIVLVIAVFVVRKTVPVLPWRDPAGELPGTGDHRIRAKRGVSDATA
jgi:alpha-1,6-mannosyltransferase